MDDVREVLREALGELRPPGRELERMLRRVEQRTRLRRITAISVSLALSVAAGAVLWIAFRPTQSTFPDRRPASTDGWTEHQDPEDGLLVTAPATWTFNPDPVPNLVEPPIVFAVGTGDVPQGGDCAPKAAMDALPADGVLLWVIEYEGAQRNPYEFAPRSDELDLGPLLGPFECVGERTHLTLFRHAGRYFQAHVMLGPEASDVLRDQAVEVLFRMAAEPKAPSFRERCARGPWTHCPEAAWVFRALHEAGYAHLGDTGSAIEAAREEVDLFVWATDADAGLPEVTPLEQEIADGLWRLETRIDGIALYSDDVPGKDEPGASRFVWTTQGFDVWVELAFGSARPGEDGLARLVRATVAVPFVDESG